LAQLIGLDEVKYQVARLKSSVAMAIRRQDRGLTVAQRTNHLVFAGPPGTGKTTIARVVAKIYCGLGLLKKETVREVHRADLIGQHIGETEAKTNTRASSVSIATKPKSFLAPVDTRAMRCGRCRHRRSGRRSRLQARQLTHVSLQRAPFELTASQWRSRVRRH
jgi:DNA polymerase III delta prime subunit